MANAREYPSTAFIKKMLALARAEGIEPGGFEVAPGGVIRVLPKAHAPAHSEFEKWQDHL